jgi:hypothetical protein
MICYFMSLIRKSCADEEISRAVGDLRDDVRRKHDDIRTNNKVFKTMFTFVNNFRNSLIGKATTGQRAKRKRDSGEDVGPGRKPIPYAGTPQLARRANPASSSMVSSQRKSAETRATLRSLGPKIPMVATSQTNVTTPAITSTLNASSRGSVTLQPSALPQKLTTSGPSPVNTPSSRPAHLDPLAVVEAAKLQAGQYNRSGKSYSLGFVTHGNLMHFTFASQCATWSQHDPESTHLSTRASASASHPPTLPTTPSTPWPQYHPATPSTL